MNFSNFDLFSSQFCFNLQNSFKKKGTFVGSIISISIVGACLYYFSYLLNLFVNNQIDPNYKAQNFSNDQNIQMDLSEDLVAFRFESSYNINVDKLEEQTQKKYIVFYAFYLQQNQTTQKQIQVDIIRCSSPTLAGFYCLDFSKLENKTLQSDKLQNLLSQIQINIYGCLDTDNIKKTVPLNCADDNDIQNVINSQNSGVYIKIKTSQFNTTSKKIETSYRGSFIMTLQNQLFLTFIKIQQQTSTIKQGFIIQEKSSFTSPLSYDIQHQGLDREQAIAFSKLGSISQVNILLDEQYSQIQIQYLTFPFILSQVNSVFQMLILFGFFVRYFSQNQLKNDFIFTLLQSTYIQKYLQILQSNKLISETKVEQQIEDENNLKYSEELKDKDIFEQTQIQNKIQNIDFKSKQILDLRASRNNSFQTSYHKSPNIDFVLSQSCQKLNLNAKSKISYQEQSSKANTVYQDSNQFKYQQNEQEASKIESQDQIFNKKNNYSFTSKVQNQQHDSIFYQDENTQQLQESTKNQKNIVSNNQIMNIYGQLTKIVQNSTISRQVQNILFKNRFCKNANKNEEGILNKQQKAIIESQVNKDLNIFQFYKDVLFLKKAIMILFSKDQLSMLQFVGCSDDFLNLNSNYLKSILLNKEQKVSHFEKQQAILFSEDVNLKYVQKFMKRQQNLLNQSKIDKRILSSLPKNLKNY